MSRITHRLAIWLTAAPLLLLALATLADNSRADYTLDIHVDPATHELDVRADIVLPETYAGQTLEFLLTDAVKIVSAVPAVKQLPRDKSKGFSGINGSSTELSDNGHAARYQVRLPAGGTTIHIEYRGAINFVLGDMKEQSTRGFRRTAGIIGDEGIYLDGSSLWYPYFSDELINFRLSTNVPDGWHLISQGNGTSREEQGAKQPATAHWYSGGAMDEINLVGGPLIEYSEPAGAVDVDVYLHEPDEALGEKIPDRHRPVPGNVPQPDRPLPLQKIRPGRKFLGNRLRHAYIHAAGATDYPLPVHPDIVISARDPA